MSSVVFISHHLTPSRMTEMSLKECHYQFRGDFLVELATTPSISILYWLCRGALNKKKKKLILVFGVDPWYF